MAAFCSAADGFIKILYDILKQEEKESLSMGRMFGRQSCYPNERSVLLLTSGGEPWNGLIEASRMNDQRFGVEPKGRVMRKK